MKEKTEKIAKLALKKSDSLYRSLERPQSES
jgi:hypothetical protein